MGGKNCVIVDADADLDEAVPASSRSAFGYAGQKCSAASRVLVHEAIADALLERLAGAADALVVGQAEGFATDVPPVIEREAQRADRRLPRARRRRGPRSPRRRRAAGDGLVLPARGRSRRARRVARCCARRSSGRCSRSRRCASIEEACEIVDGLPFALTGGLYSRNPRTIERSARARRWATSTSTATITGAMVGRQPFGGNGFGHRLQGGRAGLPAPVRRARAWSPRTRCATASRPRAAPPEQCGRSNATTPLSRAAQMRRPRFRGVVCIGGPLGGGAVFICPLGQAFPRA